MGRIMRHEFVWKMYSYLFSTYAKNTKVWFPSGKNTIRVRMDNDQEFIFTYKDQRYWKLETVDNFIDHDLLKGDK